MAPAAVREGRVSVMAATVARPKDETGLTTM
jgi:hypothetical protein